MQLDVEISAQTCSNAKERRRKRLSCLAMLTGYEALRSSCGYMLKKKRTKESLGRSQVSVECRWSQDCFVGGVSTIPPCVFLPFWRLTIVGRRPIIPDWSIALEFASYNVLTHY